MAHNGKEAESGNIKDNAEDGEKLLVLPLGEESKKITQVISNDTAREIIKLLAERSMSASDIAHTLAVPLTTITYNIENLVDVGLVKIERTKYSEKGRQVKIYAPVRKLIVVVPEKTDRASIADVLKKYLGVILAAVFATGLIELLTGPYFKLQSTMTASKELEGIASDEFGSNVSYYASDVLGGTVNETALTMPVNDTAAAVISRAAGEAARMPTPLPTHLTESAGMAQKSVDAGLAAHQGLWFLFGCIFILLVVIIADYYRRRKKIA